MRKITDDKIIRPPVKSHGIKTKLIPDIVDLINNVRNENSIYVEPFLGTGIVALNVGMQKSILSDVNVHVINLYKKISSGEINSNNVREYFEIEGDMLRNGGQEYYNEVRKRFNETHNLFDFLFISRACFNGLMRFNSKGGFNTPFCKKDNRFNKSLITKISNQIEKCSKVITEDWEFYCCDYAETLEKCTTGNEIVYCDPPYMGRDVNFFGSWNEEKEETLSIMLKSLPCKFIMSTWHHDSFRKNNMVDKYWSGGGLTLKLIDHFYHVGATVERRNSVVEALIFNF